MFGLCSGCIMTDLLYSGKVKQVWSTDDLISSSSGTRIRYQSSTKLFSLIPRKGESLNRASCHWFRMIEDEGICKTHIIEMNAPDRVLARRFDVIREPGAIPRDAENFFVPLK